MAVGSTRKFDEDFPAKRYTVGDYLDFFVPTFEKSNILQARIFSSNCEMSILKGS